MSAGVTPHGSPRSFTTLCPSPSALVVAAGVSAAWMDGWMDEYIYIWRKRAICIDIYKSSTPDSTSVERTRRMIVS